ncbi:hypothetical protein [Shewanella sp. HL-SH2]|uniref:hypothetical protein n=1 Tax=Shewanella sp. HL-SH2 TaxID=3436238 RepID=UPI003EBC176D
MEDTITAKSTVSIISLAAPKSQPTCRNHSTETLLNGNKKTTSINAINYYA